MKQLVRKKKNFNRKKSDVFRTIGEKCRIYICSKANLKIECNSLLKYIISR